MLIHGCLNEGGYEVLWSKQIEAGDVEGTEFAWGRYTSADVGGTLNVIYCSESHQLDVELHTQLTADDIEKGQQNGWDEIITSDCRFSDRMAQGVSIGK